MVNGEIVAQGSQFSLNDVEVITAVGLSLSNFSSWPALIIVYSQTVDIEDVRTYRYKPSRGMEAIQAPAYKRIEIDASLSNELPVPNLKIKPSPKIDARYHSPQEEIALGPACWLVRHVLLHCSEAQY